MLRYAIRRRIHLTGIDIMACWCSDVDAQFILCTSKIYTYVLNLKKIIFYFFNLEGFGECAYETGGVQYLQQG